MEGKMDSDEEWSRDGFTKKSIFSAKNKCQFCSAFSIDELSSAVHSEKCVARLSAFMASDGQIKFACMVCRDVFDGISELSEHELLHIYPGGFGCTMCNDTFMNERDRVRHTEEVHKTFECLRCESESQISGEAQYIEHCEREHSGLSGYALCIECGAGFEEKSHLRFHGETECGHFRSWTCSQCAAIFSTQNALNAHVGSHLPNGIKSEIVPVNIPPLEFADLNVHKTGEHSYSPMDESHYSDDDSDDSPTKQNLKIVKVEELDPIDGLKERFEDEEQQQDHGGDTESEYEEESNASDDTENEKDTEKRPKNLKDRDQLTCSICDMKFARYSRLYYHVGQHHRHEVRRNENGSNENECESCGRCFTAPQYLEQHFRDKHAKYKCEKCGITVMLKLQLYQHFASDCGRKPVNVCVVCKKSFDTADELKAHKATHTPSQLKCTHCDKVYDTYNQLRIHSIKHTTLNDWFHCKHCPRKFRREAVLRSHMSKHTGVKPLQCHACGERFLTFKKLQAHRKSRPKTCKLVGYHPISETADDKLEPKAVGMASRRVRINDLEYACTICEQKYAYKRFLDKHILLHGADGKLVHKCECCSKYFATSEEKNLHRKEVHAVEITCPHCEKICLSRSSLRTHIRIKHLKQHPVPRYTCVKCGLSFVSREFHENHEKSNCGQNPIFTCKVCGKCLTNKYTYRNHLSLHRDDSETKTFICTYCGKGWRSKSQLQSHTRFHTNERPYKCDFCDKRFCDPTSRKTHESIHTGIKPYMCQCGDRFSCISNLQSHRRARKTTCGLLPLISKAFPQMIPENDKSAKK